MKTKLIITTIISLLSFNAHADYAKLVNGQAEFMCMINGQNPQEEGNYDKHLATVMVGEKNEAIGIRPNGQVIKMNDPLRNEDVPLLKDLIRLSFSVTSLKDAGNESNRNLNVGIARFRDPIKLKSGEKLLTAVLTASVPRTGSTSLTAIGISIVCVHQSARF